MSKTPIIVRQPWEERWIQPTVAQLMKPLNEQHKKAIETLKAMIEKLEHQTQLLAWYGPSWNWTIEYQFTASLTAEPETFCYLVPRIEMPLICIPLKDSQIGALPLRRLNKYIRDAVKSAKWAGKLHWCSWTPSNQTEVAHLIDLLERKYKLTTGDKI